MKPESGDDPAGTQLTFKSKDMTQAIFEVPDDNRKKRKRNRETLSCTSCRDRKVACNREQPCANCVRYKRADECVYVSEQARKPNGSAKGTSATASPNLSSLSLDQRLANMENAVNTISEARAIRPASKDSGNESGGNNNRSPTDIVLENSDRNIFAQGRLACKPTKATYYVAATAWSIPGPYKCFYDNDQLEERLGNRLRRIHASLVHHRHKHETVVSSCFANGANSQNFPADVLPPDMECVMLARRFLDTVNVIYPIVNRATFMTELQQYLTDRSSVSESWVALLTVIVAIGYAVPVGRLPDFSYRSSIESLEQLTAVAQHATYAAASKSHRPALTVFQALLGLILARRMQFQWIDANNSTSGLLGVAQRVVFTMGLHRDSRLARKRLEVEDGTMRETLFHTYLLLEYTNSLETGAPFLMRPSDFDARSPGSALGSRETSDFLKAFPALSTGLHLSHSSNCRLSNERVKQTLRTLDKTGDAAIKDSGDAKLESVMEMLQSSLVPTLANRLQTAMFDILLEQGPAEYRQSLATDMYKPAFAILDTYDQLMAAAEVLETPEVREGAQKVIHMCMRSQVSSAYGYILVLMKLSLADPSLLTARAPNARPIDSSFVFRKLRTAAEWAARGLHWSWQVAREVGSMNAYLNAVQAQYQIFVDTGVADPDLLGPAGKTVVDAMANGIESTLERAGIIPKGGLDAGIEQQMPADMTDVELQQTVFNLFDPSLFQNLEWPWTDLVASDQWQSPTNGEFDMTTNMSQLERPYEMG